MLRACGKCGGTMERVRRSLWGRVLYRAAFQCGGCGARDLRRRRFLRRWSMVARCPRCFSSELTVRRRRDPSESFRGGVIRRLQGWMGVKLCYCARCRLQFYDSRRRV